MRLETVELLVERPTHNERLGEVSMRLVSRPVRQTVIGKTYPARIAQLGAIVVVALVAVFAAPGAASALPGAQISATRYLPAATYPGIQHLHFEYGPIAILPGQNNIEIHPNQLKPSVPGYITRFAPNLIYTRSRQVPRVDVVHLHHGVWLMNGYPTMAAGEEKTTLVLPQGYGYHCNPSDRWLMNYMIHNLTPTPTSVKLTYNIDFVPDSAPAAKSIVAAHPLWMDVAGLKAYPVFDAGRGQAQTGALRSPTRRARARRRRPSGPRRRRPSRATSRSWPRQGTFIRAACTTI